MVIELEGLLQTVLTMSQNAVSLAQLVSVFCVVHVCLRSFEQIESILPEVEATSVQINEVHPHAIFRN